MKKKKIMGLNRAVQNEKEWRNLLSSSFIILLVLLVSSIQHFVPLCRNTLCIICESSAFSWIILASSPQWWPPMAGLPVRLQLSPTWGLLRLVFSAQIGKLIVPVLCTLMIGVKSLNSLKEIWLETNLECRHHKEPKPKKPLVLIWCKFECMFYQCKCTCMAEAAISNRL